MILRALALTLCLLLKGLVQPGLFYGALPGSCDGTTTPTLSICVPPAGQDPWFEEWLDFATKMDTHAAGTLVHGATALNTASRIVARDASGNFAAGTMTGNLAGNATTATALSANPSDCSANTFATGIDANGNLTCSAVSIAGSIYLPLAAGSGSPLTNQLFLDNLGLEFDESDTNPTCAAGRYSIYADLSETKFKMCSNGVVTDVGTGASSAFNSLTSGTNTTAAMIVGSGASLAVSGSGTIAATTAAALASNPSDCSANQFATTIAANGNLTCAALTDADVPNTITVTLAATATALAANGANCSAGSFPLGVDASGAVESCTDAATQAELTAAIATLQPLDADLTAVAALSCSNGQIVKLAGGVWTCGLDAAGGVIDGDKGDITASSSGAVWTIDNDVVSNAKLANVATATLKGRTTAGTGDPEDLTATQATALLDAFTSGAKGLAPASGGGTINFLRADGTWAAPATVAALSANPTDCSANQFATTIAANGDLTCAALADADIPDTITASNYLPLAGGTLTGQVLADNLGIAFDESDTNPSCAAGDFNIYADLSENKLKKCVNGAVTDL